MMQQAIATLSIFSMMLLAAGSAVAQDLGDAKRAEPRCTLEVVEVGAACPVPDEVVDVAVTAEAEAPDPDAFVTAEALDTEFPIYVPPNRGSTVIHAGTGVRGARRPGTRL
jgi:hypothetical protein